MSTIGGSGAGGTGSPDWRTRISQWTGDYWPHLLAGMLIVAGAWITSGRRGRGVNS